MQISDGHSFSLALITYCGCIISIVCLFLAFITFSCFKSVLHSIASIISTVDDILPSLWTNNIILHVISDYRQLNVNVTCWIVNVETSQYTAAYTVYVYDVVTTTIRLRIDGCSTAVRRAFNCLRKVIKVSHVTRQPNPADLFIYLGRSAVARS